jgi:hypothetical protein
MPFHPKAGDWVMRPEYATYDLGMLPLIFLPIDKRPAREQIEHRYAHGGGYHESPGDWHLQYGMDLDGLGWAELLYPGDPALKEIARCELASRETVVLFECSFVAIIQPENLAFAVVRMD